MFIYTCTVYIYILFLSSVGFNIVINSVVPKVCTSMVKKHDVVNRNIILSRFTGVIKAALYIFIDYSVFVLVSVHDFI